MSLTDYQSRCLVRLYLGDEGVQMREPTKRALIRHGLARRENLPNGITNGWRLRLTDAGRQRAAIALGVPSTQVDEVDELLENWESYW